MGEWKDESSWARGDIDRTPKTWSLTIRGTRLTVMRHMDYPGKWCTESFGEVRMTLRETDCASAEAAQVVALERLRLVCASILSEIEEARRG